MAKGIRMEWKRQWLVVIGALFISTGAFADLMPSAAFTAVTDQGRPMTGASLTVVDDVGAPVTACSNLACTIGQTTVPATGIVQFWADPGEYTVTLAGAGITRIFTVEIVNPTGSSGITSVNSQTGPAITLAVGTSGTDFAVANSTNTVTFNLPSASASARGVVTTGSQSIAGLKTFTTGIADNGGLSVNNTNGAGFFTVKTASYNDAILVDPTTDQVSFFAGSLYSLLQNMVTIDVPAGNAGYNGLWVQNTTASGTGIFAAASGNGATYGLSASSSGSSDGAALLATASNSTSQAGKFTRATAANVPIVSIDRNNSSDTQAMLELNDTTSSAAGVPIAYNRNGTTKFFVSVSGGVYGLEVASNATFGLTTDVSTGYGFVGSDPCIYDGGTPLLCATSTSDDHITTSGYLSIADNSSNPAMFITQNGAGDAIQFETTKFVVSGTGELAFAGVSADGTGKALCVKSDGNIGTCTTTPTSGSCTCA